MSEKSEKLIIVGPSGSGKDFLRRALIRKSLRYEPKITTRPIRNHEVDGVDYNFVSEEKFLELKNNDLIKVEQSFKIGESVWYYGITTDNFEKNQLFIMTPDEISQLTDKDLSECFVVYLDIDIEIRRVRLKKRNDNNDSIERRLMADLEDFKNYDYYDLKITDPDFTANDIYDLMY
jgi:guanylate kinase